MIHAAWIGSMVEIWSVRDTGYHATNSSKKQINRSYEPRCSPHLHLSRSLAPASQWWLRPGYHVAIHPRKHQKCRSTTSASESKCGEVVNLLTFMSKATSIPVCDVWKKWWKYRGPKKKHCWTTAKRDSKKEPGKTASQKSASLKSASQQFCFSFTLMHFFDIENFKTWICWSA